MRIAISNIADKFKLNLKGLSMPKVSKCELCRWMYFPACYGGMPLTKFPFILLATWGIHMTYTHIVVYRIYK